METKKKGDEQRLFEVLHKLELEDPCFRVERHPATNETVIRALGELHLRTKLEKLTQQYKLELDTRPPRIPYRETISRKAEGHCRHKKQTGGAGQFGEVYLRDRAAAARRGLRIRRSGERRGDPTVFIPAVEKGVRMALDAGVIAGYPVEDVRVIVYDGKSHAVDSKEIAFVSAGRKAVIDAFSKAAPIMLEPIVNIEIDAPEAYVGDMTAEIASKRGQITGTQPRSGRHHQHHRPGAAGRVGRLPEPAAFDHRRAGLLVGRVQPLRPGARTAAAAADVAVQGGARRGLGRVRARRQRRPDRLQKRSASA